MADNSLEHTFNIHVQGDRTFDIWDGQFTVKTMLSHADQMRQDSLRREFLGPNAQFATDRAITQADTFADLAVRITKAPDWWASNRGGLDLKDDNVVTKIHEAALKAEKDKTDELRKKGAAAAEALKAVGT